MACSTTSTPQCEGRERKEGPGVEVAILHVGSIHPIYFFDECPASWPASRYLAWLQHK